MHFWNVYEFSQEFVHFQFRRSKMQCKRRERDDKLEDKEVEGYESDQRVYQILCPLKLVWVFKVYEILLHFIWIKPDYWIPTLSEISKIGNLIIFLLEIRIDLRLRSDVRGGEGGLRIYESKCKYVLTSIECSRVVGEDAMRKARETFAFFAAKTFLSMWAGICSLE